MPIRIDDQHLAENDGVLEVLCEDEWTIAPQLDALERWLNDHADSLPPGSYVADIGIRGVPPEATGGGAVLSVETMRTLVRLGMELWISEYGGGRGEDE